MNCPDIDTLQTRLRPLLPQASKPQLANVTLFVWGLLAACTVHLPQIALHLPVAGAVRTGLQHLERLLQNNALQPGDWYKGVARRLLARFAGEQIELILDGTDLGDRHPMLFVAVGYKGRALPVLWRMLPHGGASGWDEQQPLLTAVAALLPARCRVVLLADREYPSVGLMHWCKQEGWAFCLRLRCDRWCRLANGRAFQMRDLPLRPGTTWYEDAVTLDDLPGVRLSLSCGWSEQDKNDEAWYILSVLPAGGDVLACYARRFLIEQMFRDFKEQGFRLEKTRLRHAERVSRLVLCVCLAYVCTLLMGEQIEAAGLRRLVDRHTKRQLSLFQIGLRCYKRWQVLRRNVEPLALLI